MIWVGIPGYPGTRLAIEGHGRAPPLAAPHNKLCARVSEITEGACEFASPKAGLKARQWNSDVGVPRLSIVLIYGNNDSTAEQRYVPGASIGMYSPPIYENKPKRGRKAI
eukprot:1512679-Rhodomonas_salina.2